MDTALSLILSALLCVSTPVHSNEFSAEYIQGLKEKVSKGDAEAQYLLGISYEYGLGLQQDIKEAASLYRKSAESGHSIAQSIYGKCLMDGKGVPKDESQGFIWLEKSAEQGNTFGESQLGACYWYGVGTPKDPKKAATWLTRAAEKGDALAQSLLGELYFRGEGVPKDDVRGYMWMNLASVEIEHAQKFRDGIERFMTKEQIAEAQKLSSEFVPKTTAPSAKSTKCGQKIDLLNKKK